MSSSNNNKIPKKPTSAKDMKSLLEEFDVDGCSELTDETIKAVVAGCVSITTLSVDGCSNLTPEYLCALRQNFPLLLLGAPLAL